MKVLQTLPQGYSEKFTVSLQKDKRSAVIVNVAALAIIAIMIAGMCFFKPITVLFDMSDGLGAYFLRWSVILIAIIVYIILHELVHGVAMKYFGSKKVKYGFNLLYAFVGSNEFFDKRSYIVILLAPVVFWGIVLAILGGLVPNDWFWVVYVVQIMNVSVAAGDIYVTAKFSKLPKDILIKDTGLEMTVYERT